MGDALITFKAAGHIRFGLGGPPDGNLADDEGEFLPAIVVPLQRAQTYYRKFYIVNEDTAPFYRWKVSVKSDDPIGVEIAYAGDEKEILLNAEVPPKGASSWGSQVSGESIRKELFEVGDILGFWLKVKVSDAEIESKRNYSVVITFDGYA